MNCKFMQSASTVYVVLFFLASACSGESPTRSSVLRDVGERYIEAIAKRDGLQLSRLFADSELTKLRTKVGPIFKKVSPQADQLRSQIFQGLTIDEINSLPDDAFVGGVMVRLFTDASITFVPGDCKMVEFSDASKDTGWILGAFELTAAGGGRFNVLKAVKWSRLEGNFVIQIPDEYWMTAESLEKL